MFDAGGDGQAQCVAKWRLSLCRNCRRLVELALIDEFGIWWRAMQPERLTSRSKSLDHESNETRYVAGSKKCCMLRDRMSKKRKG